MVVYRVRVQIVPDSCIVGSSFFVAADQLDRSRPVRLTKAVPLVRSCTDYRIRREIADGEERVSNPSCPPLCCSSTFLGAIWSTIAVQVIVVAPAETIDSPDEPIHKIRSNKVVRVSRFVETRSDNLLQIASAVVKSAAFAEEKAVVCAGFG